MNELTLYNHSFASRLLLGSALYPSEAILLSAIDQAKPAMVTVALRRATAASLKSSENEKASIGISACHGLLTALSHRQIPRLPNTAGCLSTEEAVNTAQMARDLFETDWIKLEIIGDDYTLQPDSLALVEASAILIKKGFKVLPYCTEDLVIARRLLDVGCEVLMPWAAPIGTGLGVINAYGLRTLRERLPDVPMIIDAGLGLPSHAAQVMEWGFDGVLLNTAVSQSNHPELMACAFAEAIRAGRNAFFAGPCAVRESARPTTAVVGMPFWHQAT